MELPPRSSTKAKKGKSKLANSELSAGAYVLKQLNSVALPQRLEWLKNYYDALNVIHQSCGSNISNLQKNVADLQTEILQIQQDNEKQVAAVDRLNKLCRSLHSKNTAKAVETIREDEERKHAAIRSFAKAVERNIATIADQIDGKVVVSEKCVNLQSRFKSYDEEVSWLDQHVTHERQLIEAEMKRAALNIQDQYNQLVHKRISLGEKVDNSELSCAELKSVVNKLQLQIQVCIKRYDDNRKSKQRSTKKINQRYRIRKRQMQRRIKRLKKEIIYYQSIIKKYAVKLSEFQKQKDLNQIPLNQNLGILQLLQHTQYKLNESWSKGMLLIVTNGINLALELKLLQKGLPSEPKKKMLMPVVWRLCKIRALCVTNKDQESLMALMHSIHDSKSIRELKKVISLCLGFINYKLVQKKQCQHEKIVAYHAPDAKTNYGPYINGVMLNTNLSCFCKSGAPNEDQLFQINLFSDLY